MLLPCRLKSRVGNAWTLNLKIVDPSGAPIDFTIFKLCVH